MHFSLEGWRSNLYLQAVWGAFNSIKGFTGPIVQVKYRVGANVSFVLSLESQQGSKKQMVESYPLAPRTTRYCVTEQATKLVMLATRTAVQEQRNKQTSKGTNNGARTNKQWQQTSNGASPCPLVSY